MKTTLNIILVLLGTLICIPGQSQQWKTFTKKRKKKEPVVEQPVGKAWELSSTRTHIKYTEGDYTATFSASNQVRFPKSFIASVDNRALYTGVNILSTTYRGICAKEILLHVNFIYRSNERTLLDTYKVSNNPSDLPIHDMLKPLVKGFEDQCEELEFIRIEFPTYDKKVYRGTLVKSAGWKLEDGWKDNNSDYVFTINTGQDHYTYLGTYYQGKCEKSATLHISPKFANDTERTFYKKDASFYDYSPVAKIALERYIIECPSVETINFTLEYVPDNYRCKEGADCVLTAKKSSNWEVDKSNFEPIPYEAPLMTNYKDVIELLAKGDLESFKNYDTYFKLFYEEYSDLYGSYCGSNLKKTTKITTFTFEKKTFAGGSQVESELYPPRDVFIETEYLPTYNQFKAVNKSTNLRDALSMVMQVNKQGNLSAINNELSKRLSNSNYITTHLEGQCNSPTVKIVYENMQKLASTLYAD